MEKLIFFNIFAQNSQIKIEQWYFHVTYSETHKTVEYRDAV